MHPNALRSFFSADFSAAEEELDLAREADLSSEVEAVALRAVAGRCTVTCERRTSPAGERWIAVRLSGEFERSDIRAVEGALVSAGFEVGPSATFGGLCASLAA